MCILHVYVARWVSVEIVTIETINVLEQVHEYEHAICPELYRAAVLENKPETPDQSELDSDVGIDSLTSSSRMIWGALRMVRAMATLCFSPPLSFRPLSPTCVL